MAWCQSIHWPERIFITHLSQPMTLTLTGKFALSLSENTTRAGNGCAYGFISPCTSNSGVSMQGVPRWVDVPATTLWRTPPLPMPKKVLFCRPAFHFKREAVFVFGSSKVPLPNEKVIFWFFFFCFVLFLATHAHQDQVTMRFVLLQTRVTGTHMHNKPPIKLRSGVWKVLYKAAQKRSILTIKNKKKGVW